MLTEPIRTDAMLHWLAVASRRRSVSRALAEPAIEAAHRLIIMIVRSHASVQADDRLRRAELLRLITAGEQTDPSSVWGRLEMYRFDRDEQVRLLLLTDPRWSARGADQLSQADDIDRASPLERTAVDAGLRLLLAPHGARVLGLADSDEAPFQRWLAALPHTVHCGMSASFNDLTPGPSRLREAETALAAAVREQHQALRFEQVDLVDWLVTGHDARSVQAKAQQTVSPIADHEPSWSGWRLSVHATSVRAAV